MRNTNSDLKVTTIEDLKNMVERNPQLRKSYNEMPTLDFGLNKAQNEIIKQANSTWMYDYNKQIDRLIESSQRDMQRNAQKEKDLYDFAKATAQSSVANAQNTERIKESNEQLLILNKILLKDIQRVNTSINNLTDEFIDRSKINELVEYDQAEKLSEMIELLKNPNDNTLLESFKGMPVQLIIGLALEAIKKELGLG